MTAFAAGLINSLRVPVSITVGVQNALRSIVRELAVVDGAVRLPDGLAGSLVQGDDILHVATVHVDDQQSRRTGSVTIRVPRGGRSSDRAASTVLGPKCVSRQAVPYVP